MKKLALFVIALTTCGSVVLAQAPDIEWSYSYETSFSGGNSIIVLPSGGLIIAGAIQYNTGYGPAELIHLDKDGNELWTRYYWSQEIGSTGITVFRDIELTPDGGFIAVGHIDTVSPNGGGCCCHDDADLFVVKTTAEGTPQWSRIIGNSDGETNGSDNEIGYDVELTPDGGYIIAGYTNFLTGTDQFYDAYAVRLNSAGDTLWTRTYGKPNVDDGFYSTAVLPDGRFVFSGSTNAYNTLSQCDPDPNTLWVVCTYDNGDTVWTREFPDYIGNRPNDIEIVGEYIVIADTKRETIYNYGALIRIDFFGNFVWQRAYGAYTSFRALDAIGSQGFVACGEMDMYPPESWVVRTDSLGNEFWSRRLQTGTGVPQYVEDVKRTMDGGYVITGAISTSSPYSQRKDISVAKFEPEYPNAGYVCLISPGPPDWGYRLHWVSGALYDLVFTNFCAGTQGSVNGDAAADWTVSNYGDWIVFSSMTPLTSGTLDTFWLSHPSCDDVVTWTVGDSSSFVDGPLPVELMSFDAVPTAEGIEIHFVTASEQSNSHFEILRSNALDGEFEQIARIESYGDASTEQTYSYLDRNVIAGVTYWYYLVDEDLSGNRTEHPERMISATAISGSPLPDQYSLSAYPNPFNATTTLAFDLVESGTVDLRIYDLTGREAATITNNAYEAGRHEVEFDASDLPSGIYFARLETGAQHLTEKVVLLK